MKLSNIQDIITTYELLFCIIAGFFAGIFKILDHNVEKDFKGIILTIITSLILGLLGYFLFDFGNISERLRIGLSFILAYGGSRLLNRIIDICIEFLERIFKK